VNTLSSVRDGNNRSWRISVNHHQFLSSGSSQTITRKLLTRRVSSCRPMSTVRRRCEAEVAFCAYLRSVRPGGRLPIRRRHRVLPALPAHLILSRARSGKKSRLPGMPIIVGSATDPLNPSLQALGKSVSRSCASQDIHYHPLNNASFPSQAVCASFSTIAKPRLSGRAAGDALGFGCVSYAVH